MIREVPGRRPRIDPDAYVDPQAAVIGDVTITAGASGVPFAVLRGDQDNYVTLGRNSNVQDNSVLPVTTSLSGAATTTAADPSHAHPKNRSDPSRAESGRRAGAGGRGRPDPFPKSGDGSRTPRWSPAAAEPRTRAAGCGRPLPPAPARAPAAGSVAVPANRLAHGHREIVPRPLETRMHGEGAPEQSRRLAVAAQRHVAEPLTRQRAEVVRVPRERLLAVGDRALVVLGHV